MIANPEITEVIRQSENHKHDEEEAQIDRVRPNATENAPKSRKGPNDRYEKYILDCLRTKSSNSCIRLSFCDSKLVEKSCKKCPTSTQSHCTPLQFRGRCKKLLPWPRFFCIIIPERVAQFLSPTRVSTFYLKILIFFCDGRFTFTLWPYFQLYRIGVFWENLLPFLFAFMLELTSQCCKQFDVICR